MSVREKDKQTFVTACRVGDLEKMEYFLTKQWVICDYVFDGWTPLQEAVCALQYEAAELLLMFGADPNFTCNKGLTPLACFCMKQVADPDKSLNMMELLLQSGANIDLGDCFDRSTIEIALAKKTNWCFIPMLLSFGCDPNELFPQALGEPCLLGFVEPHLERLSEVNARLLRKVRLKNIFI